VYVCVCVTLLCACVQCIRRRAAYLGGGGARTHDQAVAQGPLHHRARPRCNRRVRCLRRGHVLAGVVTRALGPSRACACACACACVRVRVLARGGARRPHAAGPDGGGGGAAGGAGPSARPCAYVCVAPPCMCLRFTDTHTHTHSLGRWGAAAGAPRRGHAAPRGGRVCSHHVRHSRQRRPGTDPHPSARPNVPSGSERERERERAG
jgi:hypothetical protein